MNFSETRLQLKQDTTTSRLDESDRGLVQESETCVWAMCNSWIRFYAIMSKRLAVISLQRVVDGLDIVWRNCRIDSGLDLDRG